MDESENIRRVHEVAKLRVEQPDLPQPGFKSPFNSFQEWLINLCDNEPGITTVSEYCFVLFHSPSDSFVAFVGYWNSIVDGVETRRISFRPKHMLFALPRKEYRKLPYKEIEEKLHKELKQFTKTTEFLNSFMAKDVSVNTSFRRRIWPE